MRVVRFGHHVRDGELQLVHPQASFQGRRRQAVLLSQKQQNVRGLRQRHCPRHEIRQRERWMLAGGTQILGQRVFVRARLARAFAVGDAPRFQRQAHEFPAPGNAIPIPEVVSHAVSFCG
ncbi:hypothetical protein D9M68_831280 [compost metagenome]